MLSTTEFNSPSKKSKWPFVGLVTALVLLNLLLVIACLYVVCGPLYKDTYIPAMDLVKQNKALQAQLGTPIDIHIFSGGDVKFEKQKTKHVYYKFTAKGPKEKAEIHVETMWDQGKWKIEDIVAYIPTLLKSRSFVIVKYEENQTKEAMEREVKLFIQDQHNVNYAYRMGQLYYSEADYEKSVYWFQKAADEGSAYAKNDLANAYIVGRGVDKNIEKGLVLYQQAAEAGDEYAMFNLGSYYFKEAEKPNYALAAQWYQKSIEVQPHSCSLNELAILYAKGKGVAIDTNKSKELFKEAGRILLELDGEFYEETLQKLPKDLIKTQKNEILNAFVEYQYAKFTSDYIKGFEEKYPADIALLAKTMSEKLDSRC